MPACAVQVAERDRLIDTCYGVKQGNHRLAHADTKSTEMDNSRSECSCFSNSSQYPSLLFGDTRYKSVTIYVYGILHGVAASDALRSTEYSVLVYW